MATAWAIYNETKELIGEKEINFDADVFKMALFTEASNCANAALATAIYATLTGEVTGATGYTAAGAAMTTTWVRATGTVTFGASNVTWSITVGTLTCRKAVIYDTTATTPNEPLICFSTLDTVDVVVNAGNSLTINLAAGIFSLT